MTFQYRDNSLLGMPISQVHADAIDSMCPLKIYMDHCNNSLNKESIMTLNEKELETLSQLSLNAEQSDISLGYNNFQNMIAPI